MKPLLYMTAISAMSSVAFALQTQGQQPQHVQQLENTLMNAKTAEAGASKQAHGAQQVPTAGNSYIYCEATPNSQGHVAHIGFSGSLALTVQSFTLNVNGQAIHPQAFGMFTYGVNQTDVPFGNGHLCISPFNPGIFRMPTQALTQPTIALAMEDASNQFAMLTPGSSWNFQFWYRDHAAGGSNFNLSDALHVDFPPAP
jgi:hypothetical protein